jgi:hypothetical protein
MGEKEGLDERLQYAFHLVTASTPSSFNVEVLKDIYEEQLKNFQENPNEAKQLLNVGESKRDAQFALAEHAALTTTCLGIFNLDQALCRE